MTAPEKAPPSVRALGRLVDAMVAAGEVTSRAREKQLRWVVGELGRAVGRDGMPKTAGVRLPVLLGRQSLTAYLDLAQQGVLRQMPVEHPGRASAASMQTRRHCLGILGDAAGVRVVVPVRHLPDLHRLHDTVPEGQQRELFRRLAGLAAAAPSSPLRGRLLAVVGVVLDTGARLGELCAMTVDDLAEDLGTLRVARRPQNAAHMPPVVGRVELSDATRIAVTHWLEFRRDLVALATGGEVQALWVSVQSNHIDIDGFSVARSAGLPLMPSGMLRAYGRGVRALNGDMAGQPGWSPLPTRLEQLRRAVDLEDAPDADDGQDAGPHPEGGADP